MRAVTAGLLAILIFAVSTLVHLPALHRALHGETRAASGSGHGHLPHSGDDKTEGFCAIALFAQGVDAPSFDVLTLRPDEKPVETLRLLAAAEPRVAPTHRLPPSQAPPVGA